MALDPETRDVLSKAIKNSNLILFVGAGFSIPHKLPDWWGLIKKICTRLKEDRGKANDVLPLEWILQELEDKNSKVPLEQILDILESAGDDVKYDIKKVLYSIIKQVEPSLQDLYRHEKLWSISTKIITTNYDRLLEEKKPHYAEVFANNNRFLLEKALSQTSALHADSSSFLYKIHGDYMNPETCILFNSDYESLYGPESLNRRAFSTLLSKHTFLFVGFSLKDAYVNKILDSLQQLFGQFNEKHFWISTNPDEDLKEKYNIQAIKVNDFDEDYDRLLDELVELRPGVTKTINTPEADAKKDYNYYYDRGLTHQNNNNLDEAMQLYEMALELNPDFSNAYNNIGVIYDIKADYENAMRYYDLAIEKDPNSYIGWYNRGYTFLKQDELDQGLTAIDKSISLNPNYPNAYYHRGWALLHLDQHEKAITAFKKAVDLDPNYVSAHINLGKSFIEIGNYEEGMKYQEKALELQPKNHLALYNIGDIFLKQQDFDNAISYYLKCLGQQPNYTPARSGLGQSYEGKGQFENALLEYDEILSVDPDHYKAWISKADILFDLGQEEKAIDAYQNAIRLKPDDYVSMTFLGTLLMDSDEKASLDYLDSAIKTRPDFDRAWFYKALYSAKHGNDNKDTLNFMKKSLALNQENLKYYENNTAFEPLWQTTDYKDLVKQYQESLPEENVKHSKTR